MGPKFDLSTRHDRLCPISVEISISLLNIFNVILTAFGVTFYPMRLFFIGQRLGK